MKEGEKVGLVAFPKTEKPIQVTWEPKEDITVYELAKCMPLLIHCSQTYILRCMLPDDESILRHFKIEEISL